MASTENLRRPLAMVRLNGQAVTGLLECAVENNQVFSADTFHCSFAMGALGLSWLGDATPGAVIDALALATEVTVELLFGFPTVPANPDPAELTSFIVGRVDEIHYDPAQNTVELSGRDLSSRLIDTSTTVKWTNLRASDIATQLANQHGLTPEVTPTVMRVGNYHNNYQAQIGDARTEWDLLTALAQSTVAEGLPPFVVYVRGKTLHFGPAPDEDIYTLYWESSPVGQTAPLLATPGGGAKSLSFSRNIGVLRNVVVQVSCVDMRGNTSFTVSWPKPAGGKVSPGTATPRQQVYRYSFPNLTPEQAMSKAQALHTNISRHEMTMSASLPADNVLLPGMPLMVMGTGSSFDQLYYPDSVSREFSLSGGYVMTVNAKNHPGNQAE